MQERTERGAASVELAASIPFVVFLLMLLIEVGVVMFDQLAVSQAAREGARAAAVNPDRGAAVAAATHATGLDSKNITVDVGPRPAVGGLVEVSVTYRATINLPLTGVVLLRPTVSSSAAMMVEGPAQASS
jgi:Flp pilus assembly protein TadG